MLAISLTLLLLLAGMSAAATDEKPLCSSLLGEWYNELNSMMNITREKNGVFTGLYQTNVSSQPPLPPPTPLRGFVTTTNEKDPSAGPLNALFSFNVAWNKFNSMTSWIGQCHVSDGQEVLTTLWVLAQRMANPDDLWNANTVNTNVFTRQKPGVKLAAGRPIADDPKKTEL